MSFFNRSRRSKASSSQEKTFQSSGDNISDVSGQQNESCDVGTSLFSGMTFTSIPATTAGEDLSLMGHIDLMLARQQSVQTETVQANAPDLTTIKTKSESQLLPEPIQPTPVNIPQQFNQATAKKKRSRHIVRPGYARQHETKAGELGGKSVEVAGEKPCDTVEQGKVINEDAGNLESSTQAQVSIPSGPQTPLYSIGTPTTSDENLCQDMETHVDTSSLVTLSSEGSSKDYSGLAIQSQGHSCNELEGIVDAFRDGNHDKESAATGLDKNFEVSIHQDSEGIDYGSKQDANLSDVLQNPVVLSMLNSGSSLQSKVAQNDDLEGETADLQTELESKEEVDHNVKQGLPQSMDDLVCSTNVEELLLTMTRRGVPSLDEANYTINLSGTHKLSIDLQYMDSQLVSLSEEKRSLISLEEELLKSYSETESGEYEKEQQVIELQKEESKALANDNYDLAEEISNRIDQLKADLESSRYRLPANDDKVERALKLRAEIAEKEAVIYRDSQGTLERLREEQQECLTSHLEVTTSWSAREKQRLNTDRQRLERAKDHLKLDKEHRETENMELSNEILQQTKEFQKRKDELLKERGSLQDEIVALEVKLAKLKEKDAEFTEAIKQEEKKIESVKRTFSSQQSSLEKQQREIEAREKSLQEEFESLLSTQKQFDEKVAEHNAKEEMLAEVLSTASEQLNKFKDVIKGLEEQQRFVQEFRSMEHFTVVTDSKLASLQAKHEEVSQQTKSLSNRIQMGQRSVVTLRKRLNETEAQISDLDAAKEIAKQERNFKEAKRLKEERDALKQDGTEGQEKLESLLKEIAEDKKSVEKYEQESNDLDIEIKEQDLAAAIVTVEKASLMSRELREKINRVSDESFVRALLEIEAKTCRNLISDLCQKHGLSMPDVDRSQTVDPEGTPETTSEQQGVVLEENTENCTELLEKLDNLEEKLEAAVEVEDFDEADRLQQEITRLKGTLE